MKPEALKEAIGKETGLVQASELENMRNLMAWGATDLMGKLRQELKEAGDSPAFLTYIRDYPYCGLTLSWGLTEDASVYTGWKSRQILLLSRLFPGEGFEANEDFIVLTGSNVSISPQEHSRLLKGRIIPFFMGTQGEWKKLERSEEFLQHLRDNFGDEMAKSGVGVERFAQEATLIRMTLEEQSRLAMRFAQYGVDNRMVPKPV